MREAGNAPDSVQTRPYHHGDLSRALVEAARRILEAEGPAGLSLRAVAREAGVSPAAPYHHFKDKAELLDAVAHEGWHALDMAIAEGRAKAATPREGVLGIGMAYVTFAQRNPQLYRLMYHVSRNRTAMPEHANEEKSGFNQVQCAIVDAGGDATDALDLKLSTIAAWCAAHGLAEMASFKQFEPLKEAMGGEEAFLRGVLQHVRVFLHPDSPET